MDGQEDWLEIACSLLRIKTGGDVLRHAFASSPANPHTSATYEREYARHVTLYNALQSTKLASEAD